MQWNHWWWSQTSEPRLYWVLSFVSALWCCSTNAASQLRKKVDSRETTSTDSRQSLSKWAKEAQRHRSILSMILLPHPLPPSLEGSWDRHPEKGDLPSCLVPLAMIKGAAWQSGNLGVDRGPWSWKSAPELVIHGRCVFQQLTTCYKFAANILDCSLSNFWNSLKGQNHQLKKQYSTRNRLPSGTICD